MTGHKAHNLLTISIVSILNLSVSTTSLLAQETDMETIDERMIVTAQKREESILEVPLSVSVVSGDLIEGTQTGVFQDLININPSLTYAPSGGQRGDGIFIRGIGTNAFQSGVEPTVSTVVDGVVIGRTGNFLTDLVDIERIEVLRGPQSTLFGRNASGGVINVITRRPTDELEGKLDFLATSDEEFRVAGTISGPLLDGLAGRVTAFYKEFDGPLENAFNGGDLNGFENWGVRAKLDWNVTPDTNVYVIGDWTELNRNCCSAFIGSTVNPVILDTLAEFGVTPGPENATAATNAAIASDMYSGGISAEVTHDFGAVTLTSITAYRVWEIDTEQDADQLPATEPTFGLLGLNVNGGDSETQQFSQEIRFANTVPGVIDYVAGVFYFEQDLTRFFQREIDLCLAPPPDASSACGFPLVQNGFFNTTVDTRNLGIFGQVDYDLTDRLTVSGGLRWIWDELEYDFDRPTPAIAFPNVEPFQNSDGESNTGWGGKVSAQYVFTDDLTGYASYARGYKSPAFDIVFGFDASLADSQPIDAETSDAYEAGVKANLPYDLGFLTFALYRATYSNFQAQSFDAELNAFVLQNAGEIRTQGFELDATLEPLENWSVTLGVAYTDAEITDFPNASCFAGQTEAQGCIGGTQDISGGDVPNSPDWKTTIFTRYLQPVPGPIDLFATLGYRWQTEVQFDLEQDPNTIEGSYGILDLSVGIQSDDGRWVLTGFAKNVTNNFYRSLLADFSPIIQGDLQFVPRDFERFYGVNLTWNFGAY